MDSRLEELRRKCSVDSRGCWNWTLYSTENGYWRIKKDGESMLVHRVAWEISNGRAPDGWKVVYHSCDNRKCCNPAHLELLTSAEVNRKIGEKGRRNDVPNYGNKSHSKKIEIRGKVFDSYKAAGEHFGISDNGVRKRFKGEIREV